MKKKVQSIQELDKKTNPLVLKKAKEEAKRKIREMKEDQSLIKPAKQK